MGRPIKNLPHGERLNRRLRFGTATSVGLIAAVVFAVTSTHAWAQTNRPVSAFGLAAVPPNAIPGTTLDLPRPLAAADVDQYKKIFQYQRVDDWAAADQAIRGLKDRRLLGHILAERYLHKNYKTTYSELATWLAEYGDHADAPSLYRMALKRQPKGAKPPTKPTGTAFNAAWQGDDNGGATPVIVGLPDLPADQMKRAAALKDTIRSRLRAGDSVGAETHLSTRDARLFSDAELDQLKSEIAAAHFVNGQEGRALALAAPAAERSGKLLPRAHWTAGLAAWRLRNLDSARRHFEALAVLPGASGWDLAAGAYWAGRVHLRAGRPQMVNQWLQIAAEQPRTFYGQLARRSLGLPSGFNFTPPDLNDENINQFNRLPAGARMFALIQIGESARAEAELKRLYMMVPADRREGLLLIAMRANMPALAMRLGREQGEALGLPLDGALYPIPKWRPAKGFEVDPALVYAFMRQESAFNPMAKSQAGARGLMQIMPMTARFLDQGQNIGKGQQDLLFDPELNVTLGARYLRQLIEHESVQGNLILLAAAYNGGPGNLARWQKTRELGEDSLLFIEALPSRETRHFITRVMFNYWLYSEQLGRPAPSLTALAAGGRATYSGALGEGARIAFNNDN